MKKLTAFILVTAMLFTFCASVSVAAEDALTDNGASDFYESDETDEEDSQYYYITQEEFEKYRDDYFEDKTTEKLLGKVGAQAWESLGYVLAPLAIPVFMFVPFVGALAAGAAIMAPFQGIESFIEVFSDSFYIIFHRDEMYNNFSTDRLYAQLDSNYDEETGEYKSEYVIYYKDPESNATLWSDCLPVAIKNN